MAASRSPSVLVSDSVVGWERKMRRKLAVLGLALPLLLAGVACDDAPSNENQIDEDDGRFGPGDGVDEPGPLR